MFEPRCSKARRLVLESEGRLIGSADALWLETHIADCETCQQESRELGALLEAWREAEPPALGAARIAQIERAVLEAEVATAAAARPARTWKLPVAAAAVAALVAIGSLGYLQLNNWWVQRPSRSATQAPAMANLTPKPAPATVTHGTVQILEPTGETRRVSQGQEVGWYAQLQATSGSAVIRVGKELATLGLSRGTRVTLRRQQGSTVVELATGVLAIDVGKTRVRVKVPDRGEVNARAARFVMSHTGPALSVSVVRGTLRYHWSRQGTPKIRLVRQSKGMTHAHGEVVAGEARPRVDAAELLTGRWSEPARKALTPRRAPIAPPVKRVAKAPPRQDCSVDRIRQTLRRRASLLALREIERCRGAGLSSRELGALEAKANLLAGRVRRAYTQYLTVAHRFKGSPAAQRALYSAGEIALRRLARRSQARRLFKHYLTVYPQGAHRDRVRRLLRSL